MRVKHAALLKHKRKLISNELVQVLLTVFDSLPSVLLYQNFLHVSYYIFLCRAFTVKQECVEESSLFLYKR